MNDFALLSSALVAACLAAGLALGAWWDSERRLRKVSRQLLDAETAKLAQHGVIERGQARVRSLIAYSNSVETRAHELEVKCEELWAGIREDETRIAWLMDAHDAQLIGRREAVARAEVAEAELVAIRSQRSAVVSKGNHTRAMKRQARRDETTAAIREGRPVVTQVAA